MLNPDIDWNVPIEDYQAALNSIPRAVMQQNPAWTWRPDENIQMGWMYEEGEEPNFQGLGGLTRANGPWAAADAAAREGLRDPWIAAAAAAREGLRDPWAAADAAAREIVGDRLDTSWVVNGIENGPRLYGANDKRGKRSRGKGGRHRPLGYHPYGGDRGGGKGGGTGGGILGKREEIVRNAEADGGMVEHGA
ncbi:hypothetical protein TWF281_010753 [Arthrobotrys megalospora]